ncbi:MAG: TIM barrel protein [Planctomycetia bacterium]|nr:TIM barrel protein [Planctomycetia bacterium]
MRSTMTRSAITRCLVFIFALLFFGQVPCVVAQNAPAKASADGSSHKEDIFRRDNLMAWCIVPFDAKKREPEQRAAMLEKLGFKHFAYDYRGEHIPTFDAEIEACKRHGIALDAWWFPGSLNEEAKHILAICKKHGITPQLWITGGGSATNSPEEQKARVVQEANRIRPIAEAAAAQGMQVGLYNHGGWFGEPENQLEIIAELKLKNVGIVYNQHHGHDQLERFAEFLPKIIPHLLVLNLNGMNTQGDRRGQKILQLGQGELDLKLLKIIRASGYRGPIGILGHTQDDAEARLHDNLDGLDWLLPQLEGKPAGVKPKMRTPTPGASDPAKPQASGGTNGGGYLAPGKLEYRQLPMTVELRGTVKSKSSFNVLVANDTKQSPDHWELFAMPQSGALTAYIPGAQPDHVRTTTDICDGKPRDIAMLYELERVRLFVDGVQAADQTIVRKAAAKRDAPPEKLAFLRVVEGNIGCDGTLEYVRISKGLRTIGPKSPAATTVDTGKAEETTVGLWRFTADVKASAVDSSKLGNHAVRLTQTAGEPSRAPIPSAGVHLKALDPTLKVTLVDRSPDQVYMGVKADKDGNVFVGGREGVFVFEREGKQAFKPRRELLRFPKHSIIMGLEFKDDDLFVLTCNALYRVPNGRVAREGLVPERLLWGIPLDLHISFHCLAWGSEGDLYITHGDPLINYGDWTRPDHWGHWVYYSRGQGAWVGGQGKDSGRLSVVSGQLGEKNKSEVAWRKTPYTGQGAVLRYSLQDGAVNVVATGLRGPVGLAFASGWELFTNDNDHESRADQYAPAKLLHVVPGIDFGWPRGWMASKSPERFDLVDPVCDLGRGVPCDLVYYDRKYLPDTVRGRLLQARWDRHSVTGYKLEPRSTTLTAKEETILQGDDNCRPVGLAVGAGGELFVTALYMSGNMAAPYCASDLVIVTRIDDAPKSLLGDIFFKSIGCSLGGPELTNAEILSRSVRDDYERQLGVSYVAGKADAAQLTAILKATDEPTRLNAVLAIGRKLTVPAHDETPPESLPLNYPKGNGWFHRDQQFYGSDAVVDLADFARIGSYTMAERWKAVPPSEEQEALFALLLKALEDPSERVRLQAAYFLGLLKDSRSEPRIEQVRRDAILATLKNAPAMNIEQAWHFGPITDDAASATKGYAPERGQVDLMTTHGGKAWEKRRIGEAGGLNYYYFGVQSGARQRALLTTGTDAATQVWFNGLPAKDRAGAGWIVDLQPGGNEFLLRTGLSSTTSSGSSPPRIELRSVGKLEGSLAEKLDSGMLAARLREAAAAGGSQAIGPEFLALDWVKEATQGSATEGRRLFGTLGCAKCHAIGSEQKGAGAPSLVDAKRRFTVPHLVESVLSPSRQVAEPFRAQSFTTDGGLTLVGLVVAETADGVELLLPDASRRTLAKKEIEERAPTTLSPMPQGVVKTPSELRDLLAYLMSERPTPP